MSNKINEAQLLLDIEIFLNLLIEDEDDEYDNFYDELADLLFDFNIIYKDDHEYVGYINFFVILLYDLSDYFIDRAFLIGKIKNIGFSKIKSQFIDLFFELKRDYEKIRSQKYENKLRLNKYCKSIINCYSRILVVRVDLAYKMKYQNDITIEDVYSRLDKFLNRIQNKDRIFNHVIGYAWGLEQGGKSRGYHCHLAVIYDTAYRQPRARYWGDKILELWHDMTQYKGQGYNCYNQGRVTELRKRCILGIGVIYRKDADQVENFIKAMGYLTDPDKNTDQYLRTKPSGRRVFGKGQMIKTRQ